MGALLSVMTELDNKDDVHTMELKAAFHSGVGLIWKIKIPPGEQKYIRYDILPVMDNPDRHVQLYVSAVKEGLDEDVKEEKYAIDPTLIRKNATLILNYENGVVRIDTVQGDIFSRIGCVVWLRRAIAGFWYHMDKTFKKN